MAHKHLGAIATGRTITHAVQQYVSLLAGTEPDTKLVVQGDTSFRALASTFNASPVDGQTNYKRFGKDALAKNKHVFRATASAGQAANLQTFVSTCRSCATVAVAGSSTLLQQCCACGLPMTDDEGDSNDVDFAIATQPEDNLMSKAAPVDLDAALANNTDGLTLPKRSTKPRDAFPAFNKMFPDAGQQTAEAAGKKPAGDGPLTKADRKMLAFFLDSLSTLEELYSGKGDNSRKDYPDMFDEFKGEVLDRIDDLNAIFNDKDKSPAAYEFLLDTGKKTLTELLAQRGGSMARVVRFAFAQARSKDAFEYPDYAPAAKSRPKKATASMSVVPTEDLISADEAVGATGLSLGDGLDDPDLYGGSSSENAGSTSEGIGYAYTGLDSSGGAHGPDTSSASVGMGNADGYALLDDSPEGAVFGGSSESADAATAAPEFAVISGDEDVVEVNLLDGVNADEFQPMDADFKFAASSEDPDSSEWVMSVEGQPVAQACYASAAPQLKPFFAQPKFAATMYQAIASVGLRNALSQFGFKGIVVKVPIRAAMNKAVASATAEVAQKYETERDAFRHELIESLGTVAVASNKGIFAGTKNPLKDSLMSNCIRAGLSSATAAQIITAAFSEASTAHAQQLIADATAFQAKPAETRRELTSAIAAAAFQPVANVGQSALASAIAKPVVNAPELPAAPAAPLQSLASAGFSNPLLDTAPTFQSVHDLAADMVSFR